MVRYQKQRNEYPIGSLSHGTMREEDLIPDFVYDLKQYARRGSRIGDVSAKQRKAHRDLCHEISERTESEGYYDSEDAGYDLESLFDALQEYAGPYFYFGAHPGDGSDYGFWLSEDFEREFDGLKVSDTSEIPGNYRGEVLHVNDHGNMTLYVKSARGLREVWAVV
jgi:hypothetical protein